MKAISFLTVTLLLALTSFAEAASPGFVCKVENQSRISRVEHTLRLVPTDSGSFRLERNQRVMRFQDGKVLSEKKEVILRGLYCQSGVNSILVQCANSEYSLETKRIREESVNGIREFFQVEINAAEFSKPIQGSTFLLDQCRQLL